MIPLNCYPYAWLAYIIRGSTPYARRCRLLSTRSDQRCMAASRQKLMGRRCIAYYPKHQLPTANCGAHDDKLKPKRGHPALRGCVVQKANSKAFEIEATATLAPSGCTTLQYRPSRPLLSSHKTMWRQITKLGASCGLARRCLRRVVPWVTSFGGLCDIDSTDLSLHPSYGRPFPRSYLIPKRELS